MVYRMAVAVLLWWLSAFAGSNNAVAQQPIDSASQQQVIAAILQQLAPYALQQNNLFYTTFEISGGAPSSQGSGGFA
jgi:hypothetical protein